MRASLVSLTLGTFLTAQAVNVPRVPPRELPEGATRRLAASLSAAKPHKSHVWRDTAPMNPDGTVNTYVEIARGDRRKWEFDISAHKRAIDRVLPPSVGGYPVNYGFVPQTISYDGDPFDGLVLGPALPGGHVVRGTIVGVMLMEDVGLIDSKVVLSPLDRAGRPLYRLTDADRRRIGDFFNRYKQHEPGKVARVPGWGSPEDGLVHVRTAHAFFRQCAASTARCVLKPTQSSDLLPAMSRALLFVGTGSSTGVASGRATRCEAGETAPLKLGTRLELHLCAEQSGHKDRFKEESQYSLKRDLSFGLFGFLI